MPFFSNLKSKIAGRIDKMGKVFVGQKGGQLLGKVDKEGRVFNPAGKKLGRVNDEGRVYDANLKQVGTVRDGFVLDRGLRKIARSEESHSGAAFLLLNKKDEKKAAPKPPESKPFEPKATGTLPGANKVPEVKHSISFELSEKRSAPMASAAKPAPLPQKPSFAPPPIMKK